MTPEDELTIQLLKTKQAGGQPDAQLMDPTPTAWGSQGGIQPNMADPNTIAAYRMQQAVRPDQGRPDSGAAEALGSIISPPVGMGLAAARGDWPEVAKGAAYTALPFGIGKAAQYAPTLTKAALGAWGASNVMAPEAIAGDEGEKNPYAWDNNAYLQRQKAAQRQANKMPDSKAATFMTEFEKREGIARGDIEKNALNWENTRSVKKGEADALANLKKSYEPDLPLLSDAVQRQIRNATTSEQATKLYTDAMKERNELSKTSYEKYGPYIEGGALTSGALGAAMGYGIPAFRAWKLSRAQRGADAAFDARFGVNAPHPSDTSGIAKADANLLKSENYLKGRMALPEHPGWGAAVGGSLLPEITGVAGPNLYDAMLSPYPEVKEKAWNNVIPGWLPNDQGFMGRDWSAIMNHGRALAEGVTMHKLGAVGAHTTDFPGRMKDARSMLNTIDDQRAQMAKALKNQRVRATPIPNAPATPPPATPIPNASPTPPPFTPVAGGEPRLGASPSIVPGGQTGRGTMPPPLGPTTFEEPLNLTPEQRAALASRFGPPPAPPRKKK